MIDALRHLLRLIGRTVWRAYQYLAMVLGLGFLALVCLCWLPFAVILQVLLPSGWGQPIGRRTITIAFRVYLRFLSLFCACHFDLAALDGLHRDGPMVVVANHPSLLDAVMIISRFPNVVCVMKAALMDNLLLGAAARLARYIPNGAPLALTRCAREELRAGAHLLIFPEGTRTTTFPISPFTAGAGLIAGRAKAPVQALLIEFTTPYLGKAWPLFRRPDLPLRFSIRPGRRFAPPTDAAAFSLELEAYFQSELTAAHVAEAPVNQAALSSVARLGR
jgi:1-acyl-sn-glycerol-3-phosphate acyltransferase